MNQETKNINIWESNLKEYFTHTNNIDELLNYFEKENTYEFIIRTNYNPKERTKTFLDTIAKKNNLSITYTDSNHNVTIYNQDNINKEIFINPTFFETHKNILINYTKEKVLKKIDTRPSYIIIPDFLITDELIDLIVTSDKLKNTNIHFTNNTNKYLTESQIKKIRYAHLEVNYYEEQISTRKAFQFYTFEDLKTKSELKFKTNLTDTELENFNYINKSAIITFDKEIDDFNEKLYIENLSKIFKTLKKHQRNYNIKINISNRELLNKSDILNIPNINLIIFNDLYDYQKEEYLREEIQLDKLIEPIKNAKLSPYEKYLAVYNIVKQFKPYKENHENKKESRYLRYILNNEYIVCVGFSKLLTTLLNKVDIKSLEISTNVDTSYDQGFTKDNTPTNFNGHARNIIKIDDDKYNIHGIFIADSTWDNDIKHDLYQNANLTFDRKKEAFRLESLTKYDLLLDFHNIHEFKEKITYHIKNEYKKNAAIYKEQYNITGIKTYQLIYSQIEEILSKLDYNKYIELHNKYYNLIYNDKLLEIEHSKKYAQKPINNQKELNEYKQNFFSFLKEYANYIIPLSNNKIDDTTLLNAAINAKTSINNYTEEETEKLTQTIKENNEKAANIYFPYSYNPNETRQNYLQGNVENTNKKK